MFFRKLQLATVTLHVAFLLTVPAVTGKRGPTRRVCLVSSWLHLLWLNDLSQSYHRRSEGVIWGRTLLLSPPLLRWLHAREPYAGICCSLGLGWPPPSSALPVRPAASSASFSAALPACARRQQTLDGAWSMPLERPPVASGYAKRTRLSMFSTSSCNGSLFLRFIVFRRTRLCCCWCFAPKRLSKAVTSFGKSILSSADRFASMESAGPSMLVLR